MKLSFKLQHEIDFSIVPALWYVLTCQSVASMIGKLATLPLIHSVRIFPRHVMPRQYLVWRNIHGQGSGFPNAAEGSHAIRLG
jgi:hypothetical protein